jgi:hypothetical protein
MGVSPRVLAVCPAAPRGGGDVTDQVIEKPAEQSVESVDELGPVDWLVVEFPGSRFTGEIAPILDALVDNGTVRVLDLVLVRKDDDGSLDFFELSDLDESEIGGLRAYETELALLLSAEDMTSVAAAIEPGSTAAVLVWENRWAAPFGSAVRRAGGQLVATGRIPVQALLAAIESDEEGD